MKKSLLFVLLSILLLSTVCSAFAADPIVVIYTNDVHCGYADNLGYTAVADLKDYYSYLTPNVTLVDNGDSIQGDVIGAVSKGEYVIDLMNEVGYDLAILGNHEFDYGMDRLAELAELANFQYIDCNIDYTGANEDKLDFLLPYALVEYGEDATVAYIGVATPNSISTSTPTYFQEDGQFVYDFNAGENGAKLYNRVQETVDEAHLMGADYVILLSHLGINEEDAPYRSIDVINNTVGIDACLDGHSHSVIPQMMVRNGEGYYVPLSSTGTKLAYVGVMTIDPETGNINTTLVSGDGLTSDWYEAASAETIAAFEAKVNDVVASTNVALNITDADGIRIVRSRETNLGDLCADAYRSLGNADIALVNGGGIRANIDTGDITYAEVIAVHPFGNMLTVVNATGQQILDALEWTSRNTQAEYKDAQGNAVGELGGFLQVSGLRYTIDTSVESPAVADANGMFFGLTEDVPYRVSDVQVEQNGEWVDIDPEATYRVASHNYLLKDGGDGTTMFQGDEILINESMSDYQVLITYITDVLNGDLTAYAEPQGRITVK